MKKTGFLVLSVCLCGSLLGGAMLASGCGSDSSANVTVPLTPTPARLRQQVTPPPTATSIPID